MIDAYVLDTSMAIEWIFPTEDSAEATAAFDRLGQAHAYVPHLWRFEMMNVITRLYRRGAVSKAELPRLLTDSLGIADGVIDEGWPRDIVELAAAHQLSAYDATFLSAALFADLPLATMDAALRRAAGEVGVPLA